MFIVWKEFPIVAIIGAIILVVLTITLATLQYKWVIELSENKIELTRMATKTAAQHFAEDFDRELMNIIVKLLPDGSKTNISSDDYFNMFDQRISFLTSPNLIRNLYLAEFELNKEGRLFKLKNKQLEPILWPEEFGNLKMRLNGMRQNDLYELSKVNSWPTTPFDDDIPALIVPFIRSGVVSRVIIAELNIDCIIREILPALAERHFSKSETGDLNYEITIFDKHNRERVIYSSTNNIVAPQIDDVDIKEELFRFRFSMLIEMLSASRLSVIGEGGQANTIKRLQNNRDNFQDFKFRGKFSKQSVENILNGNWILTVKHNSGSIQAATNEAMRRNLIIAFGVLILLLAVGSMVFILMRRVHLFATQQMKFVLGVSHDLRTPVAILCTASENMYDGIIKDPENTRQYAEIIKSSSYQLAELVEQVLAFAGTKSGRKQYNYSPVSVTELIDSSLLKFTDGLQGSGDIVLEKHIQDHLPLVLGDKTALCRAVINVLSNAFKYTGKYKLIRISAYTCNGDKEVSISIQDDGIGIDADDMKYIFEPFWRGKSIISSNVIGSGLGLSLVSHIMEQHNGRVSVSSKPGVGSLFTLSLPVYRPVGSNDIRD